METKYKYYNAKCKCGRKLDPYAIMRAYPHIKDPSHQHALKKLLRLGQGHKSLLQDLEEVIDSLNDYKTYLLGEEGQSMSMYINKINKNLELVKIYKNDDGDEIEKPLWHLAVTVTGGDNVLCTGEFYGMGESSVVYDIKEGTMHDITCEDCKQIIKDFKAIKENL